MSRIAKTHTGNASSCCTGTADLWYIHYRITNVNWCIACVRSPPPPPPPQQHTHTQIGSRGSPLLQPLEINVALNQTAQFSCTAPEGVARWLIFPSGSFVPIYWPTDNALLLSRGIRPADSSATEVTAVKLNVSGISTNNETRVMCVDMSDGESLIALLHVYGKYPTNKKKKKKKKKKKRTTT